MVNRPVAAVVLAIVTAGCSPFGHVVHEAFNSRDTGPYLALARTLSADGTLLVHVAAHRPEHAEEIARHIVRQNYAASPPSLRVVVDPTGEGTRRVFRWDGHALHADSSAQGLPPPPSRGAAHGGPAAAH